MSVEICAVALALALPAAWLGGATGCAGVLAGGALAVLSFRWLVARALAASAAGPSGSWLVGAGVRFLAVVAVSAVLLAGGWVHPVAFLAGFSALPWAVIVRGLRAGHRET